MEQSSIMDSFHEELGEDDVENAALETLNKLIVLLDVEHPRVSTLHQVSSNIYSAIFEKIFGYKPLDVIGAPRTIEDEGHNVQCIIDTLSMDILGISLSHITGEDVVARKPMSIYHLLEIINKFVVNGNWRQASTGRSSVSVSVVDSVQSQTASNASHHAHFCPVCEYAQAKAASIPGSSKASPCSSCSCFGKPRNGTKSQVCLDLSRDSATTTTNTRPSTRSKTGKNSLNESLSNTSCKSHKTKSSTTWKEVEPPSKKRTPFNELLAQRLMQNLERINSRQTDELDKQDSQETSADEMPLDDLYKSVFKENKRKIAPTPSRVTSVLLPRYLKRRRTTPAKPTVRMRKQRSPVASSCGQGIIEEMTANVPGAHLSEDILRCLKIQQKQQAKFLSSRMAALKRRVPASEKMLQESILKQVQLAEIAHRDLLAQERLRDVKCLRNDRLKSCGAITNNNIQKARVQRYFDQYHQQHHRKMAARNTKEEMILQDLYKHRLSLQKQQINLVTKDLHVEEREEAERLKKKMVALGKIYDDESELQKEHAVERNNQKKTRIKAQRQELEQTRRAILNQIETEVKQIQENLEDADEFHFIQADADRLKERWVRPK